MGRVPGRDGELWGYSRIPCKCWDCDYCGPKKVAELRHRISVTARELGLKRFLTLTLDPEKVGEGEDLVWYIREVWRKFRVYLKRRLGRSVSFISVLEAHKSGRLHLHVLLDQYVEQRWISEAWDRLGGGRIVFIKRVDDLSGVGWYLGKYLTKDMRLVGGSGTRRYSTSRNIRLMPARGGTGWIRAPARFDELLSAAGRAVCEVVRDGRGRVKSFTTSKPIRRMKAFDGRLMAAEEIVRSESAMKVDECAPATVAECGEVDAVQIARADRGAGREEHGDSEEGSEQLGG